LNNPKHPFMVKIKSQTSTHRPHYRRCNSDRLSKEEGMGALNFLTAMGLFIGQSNAFFSYMTSLAQAADAAQRGM
jgi:hypothetical protein